MKILALLPVLLFCLSAAALAVPESVTNGPYKISFDIGQPHSNYTIIVKPVATNETLSGYQTKQYHIEINGSQRGAAYIDIRVDNGGYVLTGDDMLNLLKKGATEDGKNGSIIEGVSARTIDNQNGAIESKLDYISTKTFNDSVLIYRVYDRVFIALYSLPDSKSIISIISFYPWSMGTSQLLDSLHINVLSETNNTRGKR